MEVKCPYCHGTGEVQILINQEALYDGMETPVYDIEPCEECGGTGEAENV